MWVWAWHLCICKFQENKGTETLAIAYIKTNSLQLTGYKYCTRPRLRHQHLFPSFQDQQKAIKMNVKNGGKAGLPFWQIINSPKYFFSKAKN